jgi:ribose transport system substrate-binding protein
MIPRKQRRRATIIMILAAGAALVAGCSSSGGSSGSTPASGTSASGGASSFSKSNPLRIGLVLPDLTNQTINDVYAGAKQQAQKLGDVQIVEGGTSDTQEWLNACQQILTAHINVLAYDTLDADSTSSCILQANAMHIPTICLFACSLKGHNDTLITLNFYDDGVLIGKWMAKAIGPNGQYGLLAGPTGDMAIQAVQKGYLTTVKADCPGCSLVANVPAGGTTADSGYTTGLQVLTAHPGITGIYAADDDIAQGLVRAVQQDNKIGKVKVAGHNGTCQALASILKGQQSYTVLLAVQPFGIDIVNSAFKLMDKQKVPTINVQVTGVDTQIATSTLGGQTPDPSGVNLQERLQDAQNGCKILG